MKHSDFYTKYSLLEEQERYELAMAVQAHGGQYTFVDCNSEDAIDKWYDREDYDDIPIVYGLKKYSEEDSFYVSRVEINGGVRIYGFSTCGDPCDEESITKLAYGNLSSIIDFIPETENVKDVSVYK